VDSTDEGVQYWLSSDIDNAKMILAILMVQKQKQEIQKIELHK